MKVSIITVVFNNRRFIEGAIKSVLSQTYKNIEYIIIDGGSTDGTLDIIDKYRDKISKIISEPDKGIYDAMNKGIRLATGEIVGILNSDDFYADENVVELVVQTMKETGADVCWGNLVYVKRDNPDKIVRFWKSSEYKAGAFQNGWMPPHPTFFVRKWVYEKYGNFRVDLPIAADFEIMLRFIERYKVKSCYLPKTIVRMREGGKSNWRNVFKVIRGNIESYRSFKLNDLKASPALILLKPLSKVFQVVKR